MKSWQSTWTVQWEVIGSTGRVEVIKAEQVCSSLCCCQSESGVGVFSYPYAVDGSSVFLI